jgi:CHAT domain-containing protein/predicted negative regulator of RcsB-dependent stress response
LVFLLKGGRVLLKRERRFRNILPPLGRAGQTPVGWLLSVMRVAFVLCSLHEGMYALDKTQPRVSSSNAFDAAMADGFDERKRGHWAEAVASFQKAADLARDSNDPHHQLDAILRLSGCRIRLFQYRQALEATDTARQLAFHLNDDTLAGANANNRATIYSQLGDYQLAARAAEEAVALLKRSPRRDYLAQALLNLGDIRSRLGQPQQTVDSFQEAVNVAHAAGFDDVEAMAEDHLGESLIEANDLAGAEKALNEAHRLRQKNHETQQLALTNENLAILAYHQGDLPRALKLLDGVLASGSTSFTEIASFWPVQLRGQIVLAMGRRSQALAQFQKAVTLADAWRRDGLPGDTTNTHTVVELHSVYHDYIELAAELSLERHDPALAREAFRVLAENRASSLREQLISVLGREMRLPPRYFELLSNLQTLQAAVTLGKGANQLETNKTKLQQIRLELTELENQIGIQRGNSFAGREKNSHKNSLRDIQLGLSARELLLSFSLGSRKSFLWAVTRDQVSLYELPGEDIIAAHAKSFASAVQRNASANAEGLLLSRELFGKVSASLKNKPEWLIAADGVLLNSIPFAALPDASSDTRSQPLISSHAMRFLPSELLITDPKSTAPEHRFLGVADPIYNLADSRRERHFSLLPIQYANTSITLARLVGSDREVRAAAKSAGFDDAEILVGASASGEKLRLALAKHPEIVHFAVHVVSPENHDGSGLNASRNPEEAALALSLTRDSIPELLTKENIAALKIPGALVILSGCSSQQGENLPSAGLVGLSRAFLLAGASAVVVSAWPTPDDSGRFFSTFYSHLQANANRSASLAGRAAAALQETQVDMAHSSDRRNLPSFWAAYSLISKE